ncbi:MAG: outer membrane protein transport protein [Deltaproteobacteria bacterium]|nr:outer membrane protein transport protein [Deltaproteobacteria bacterium]
MTRPRRKTWFATLSAVSALVCCSGAASGAGFAIIEQSVTGIGNAFAGGAASAEDASTLFFNPAGLTRLKGQQAIAGGHAIVTSFVFKNKGSTHQLTDITDEGLTGDNGGDGGTFGLVPNGYYSATLDNGWAFGLGVNAPFGLVTDWDKGWVGRYHALKSDVLTININPSAAYKITRNLSIGAGVSAMYMKAELSQAVDFGTALAAVGDRTQRDDGKATLNADDWAYGFNVGLLWEFTENTRAGLHYRSQVKQKLEGDAKFDVPAKIQAILDAAGSSKFQKTDANGDINLPDTVSLSLYHRYDPKLAVMADVTWTHWSTFDELKIEFDNPEQDPSVTTEKWDDAWRVAVGATYNPLPAWALRTGLAYDQTPVPNSKYRTPRLPDNDRYWLSFGTGYQATDRLSVDVGYAHLFVDDAKINKDPVGEDASRGGLKGTFTNSADIFSAQIAYRW